MAYTFKHLTSDDTALMKQLLHVFSAAFEDPESYESAVPSDEYLRNWLGKPHVIALVALEVESVVGGLVAYELEKFEQDRREIYIYDLAVAEAHRRKGIATNLINELKRIAKERDAYVIYVQADHEDEPAIRLYESLGSKEDVYHFDITV